MRISERQRYDVVTNRVNEAKTQNAHAMNLLSSQRNIEQISDDPIGASQIIRYRDQIENLRQFQTNIEYSKGFMERSENSLGRISENLSRLKELAVAMSNDTYDAKSRQATAKEVKEVIDEVVQIGNTTFGGRFIFGGFRSQTPTISLDGQYMGDDGQIFVEVSQGNFRPINVPGRTVFEATPDERSKGHFDMLVALDLLYQGMMNNDKTMLHTALGEIDFQIDKTSSNQATIGAMQNSFNETGHRLSAEETVMRERLSKVQDADIYQATSEFKRTEAVLQGTLLASTKLLQPSLLNFLQ